MDQNVLTESAEVAANTAVYGATIKNYNANPTRRADLFMGISYAEEGLEGAGCSIPFPQQDVHVIEISSANA